MAVNRTSSKLKCGDWRILRCPNCGTLEQIVRGTCRKCEEQVFDPW